MNKSAVKIFIDNFRIIAGKSGCYNQLFTRKYPFEELIEKEYNMDKTEEAFLFGSEKKRVRVGIKVAE